MADGRLVTFAHDVKGERLVKFLWVSEDADPTKMILVQETCYVRDEGGRVLRLANCKIASKISSFARLFHR